MKKFLRILPVLVLVVAAMSLLPAAAQDAPDFSVLEAGCDYGGNIERIEALDDFTVQFTFCDPDPAFASKAAFAALSIYSADQLVETGGGGPELFQNPIGTGAYQLEDWDLGNQIVMSRYEDYWGEPASEATLIFRWNSEAAARLVELQAEAADGIDNVGEFDFEVVENDPNLQLLERLSTNVFYLGINNTVEPFDNVMVRQALAHAIDKDRLVANFYPPGSIVASQFMPPTIFGFTPDVEPFPFDPDRARELLLESGVDLPISTTLSFRDVVRSYLPSPGNVGVDIQAQLEGLATDDQDFFDIEIVEMESGAFIDAADAGELSLHMLGWGADYLDATNFLDFHFGAGASDQFGDKHPEITEPLAEAAQLSNADARLELYEESNTAIRDLVPMIPVAHGGSAVAYRASIEGAHASPLGNEYFPAMSDPDDEEFVWIQNGEPTGIYCADETDGEALRVCEQINEPLLTFEVGGTEVVPALAESWDSNPNSTVWTFNLREGVTFHDGSDFTAEDVVASYAVQLDAGNPLHVGRNGSYTYFSAFFGGFLNAE